MAPDEYEAVEDSYKRLEPHSIPVFKVLDVGSQDVNGTLRPIFEERGIEYTGLDVVDGKNVDVVYSGPELPFDDNSFDAIVSNSCFEHDLRWWKTLEEIHRATKPGGMIIIGACSLGFPYHGDPEYNFRDYYRFTEDAYWDYILKGLEHPGLLKVNKCGRLRLCGSGVLPL
jgi:SAM-dependent methyltransferase